MSFIGAKPTAVPLTGSDITDGIITSAKITDGTIATSDISDGAVTSVKTTGVGGANTPSFHAYLSSTVEVSNNVTTRVPANTEIYDTDSAYNNTTYKFQPQTAGKYFVYGMINGQTNGYNLYFVKPKIYKNGSEYATNGNTINASVMYRLGVGVQSIVDMNGSSDYVELYGQIDIHVNGTEQFVGSNTQSCYFGAYKIIT